MVGFWVVILLIDGLWVVIGRILGCYWSDSGLLFVRFWVVIGWIMGSYWSDSGLLLVGFLVVIGRILDRYCLDYRCSRRNHTFIQSKFLIKSCIEKSMNLLVNLSP